MKLIIDILSQTHGEVERRIVSQLLTLMDGINTLSQSRGFGTSFRYLNKRLYSKK